MELDEQTKDAIEMVSVPGRGKEYAAYYAYLDEQLERHDLSRDDRLRLTEELSLLQESINHARRYYARVRHARRIEIAAQAKVPLWLQPFIGEYCYPNPWHPLKPECRPYIWLGPVNWLGLLHFIINKKSRVLSWEDLANYFQHPPEATGKKITAKSIQNNVACSLGALPVPIRAGLQATGYLD